MIQAEFDQYIHTRLVEYRLGESKIFVKGYILFAAARYMHNTRYLFVCCQLNYSIVTSID